MVVVDSSALIPLARTGKLDLIWKVYEEVYAPREIYKETVKRGKGKPGTSKLDTFFEDVDILDFDKKEASGVAEMEGISEVDAAVVLLAEKEDEVLLANDKGLMEFARIKEVKTDWVTTLVLRAVKEEGISREQGKQTLYDLIDKGMNLKNKVYARILKKIEDL